MVDWMDWWLVCEGLERGGIIPNHPNIGVPPLLFYTTLHVVYFSFKLLALL